MPHDIMEIIIGILAIITNLYYIIHEKEIQVQFEDITNGVILPDLWSSHHSDTCYFMAMYFIATSNSFFFN